MKKNHIKRITVDRNSSDDKDNGQLGDYVAPEHFVWTDEFSVICRLLFSEKPGPIRVLDSSASVLNYFQIFYSDEIFNHIVECRNGNANKKEQKMLITTKACGMM